MNDISRDPDENEMRRYRKDSLDDIEDETGTHIRTSIDTISLH